MGKIGMPGGGGGADTSVVTATAGDVLSGKVIVDKDGNPVNGSLALSGNAAAGDVLSGKTFYNTDAKTKGTGTMPNNGAVAPAALGAGGSYTIPAGYHNGSGMVTVQSLATMTASGDATAAQILSGKKAYVDGNLITGSMTNQGAQTKTITPSASAQSYTIPAGYHNGSGKVSVPAVSNLTAANIKKGVVVGGVTGTWSGYVATATDLYIRGNNAYNLTKRSSDSKSKFESGAIYITSASSSDFIFRNDPDSGSTISINLSPYTKINVEFYCTAKGQTYVNARFAYLLNSESYDIVNISCPSKKASINQSTNTTKTLSADISDINATIKGLGLRMYSSNDTSDNSLGGVTGQIYRIWLS